MSYATITSIESSSDGYFYKDGIGSLGHVLMPSNSDWASGDIVWDVDEAKEWKSQMLNAKGTWTWSVKLGSGRDMSLIHNCDVKVLKSVYEGLRSGPPYVYRCGIF